MRFEPSGFTGNPNIPMAKSIVDYIFRWLGQKFIKDDESVDSTMSATAEKVLQSTLASAQMPLPMKEKEVFATQSDAPPCHVCGSITVRAGACYACPNCGATTGCG
jgi:ribonucleoside-diphosphate reductase alpha chain